MRLKQTAALLMAGALLLSITACSSSKGESNSNASTGIGTLIGSATKIYHKDDTAEGKGFKLSINSIDSTPEMDGYEAADSGTEYFFVSFELENTSNSELDLNSFFTITADGTDCSFISFYDSYDGVDKLNTYGTLSAGKKTKNYLSAVVPTKWNEIQFTCSDGTTFSFAHTDLGSLSSQTGADETTIYHVGDTLTRNGMKITLKNVIQTDYVEKYNYSHYEPDAGKHFVIMFFDLQNQSQQSQRFKSYSTFDVFIDDYSDNFTGFLSTKINNVSDLSDEDYTDILPGKSLGGYEVVEAPDGWKKIELISRQGTFEITPDYVTIQ